MAMSVVRRHIGSLASSKKNQILVWFECIELGNTTVDADNKVLSEESGGYLYSFDGSSLLYVSDLLVALYPDYRTGAGS